MNRKMLYSTEGIECKFRHDIDYMQALQSGLYFKDNPVKKAIEEIEVKEERKKIRKRELLQEIAQGDSQEVTNQEDL